MEMSPARLSPDSPEPRDALQNQALDNPTISSQVEYLQPIEDSQEVAYEFTEGDDSIEQSSHIAHPPQPVQGRHLSRPDVDDQEDFMATFEYAKAPSRKPDPKHPGLARESQPFMSGFLRQLNVGSANTCRQGFHEQSATGYMDGKETILPNTEGNHVTQGQDFPQLPPTYEAPAPTREIPVTMGEASRSSKAQQSTMFSTGKTHHMEIPVESPATVENRRADELPDDSPERSVTESRQKPKSVPFGDTPGSGPSAGSPPPRLRHKGVSPRLSQRHPNLQEYNRHLSALSKKWNAHFSYEKRLVDQYQDSVAKLQGDLEDRDAVIQECHAEIESRDAEIDTLERENEELLIARQQMETDLSESSQRVATMEEKLRSYRECLNNAMQEQQLLYKRCKEKCKETITEIKAEEKDQKEALEKTLASSDSARISLQSKVASVIQEARNHSEQLGRTIAELQAKLEDREKEVAREKEHANDLRAQLNKSQSMHEQTLQSIVSKNQEMLEKSDRQHGTIEELRILAQGQDQKLSGILKAVEESKTGRGMDPEALAKSLQDSMTQTVLGALSEMQQAMPNRDSSTETMEQLNENMDSIRLLCEGLREQLCNSEAASDWQERFHQVNLTAQAQMQHIQELDYDLHQVAEDLNTQWQENQRLKDVLTEMKTQAQANEDSNTKIEDLIKQAERLENVLSEKDEVIKQSEEKVKIAEEKVRNQAHKLEEKEDQIRREGEEHTQSLETVIEERAKLRQQTNDLEKRVDDLICENSQLEDDLAKAHQEISLNQRNNSQLTEDLLTAEAERESFRPGHQEWKRTRVEIVQIIQICQSLKRLAKDKTKSGEMDERLKELFQIQKRLSGKSGTQDGESSPEREPSPLRQRQVLLKVPGSYERELPVSVQRERATRRQPGAVRGIMKPTARSISKEMGVPAVADPAEQAKTPGGTNLITRPRVARRGSQTTPVIHSSYNRPVAGAVASAKLNIVRDDGADDTIGRGPTTKESVNNRRRPMENLSGDVDSPPKKRQRGSTNTAEQKTKLSQSMSGLFPDQSREVPDSQPSSTSMPGQHKAFASQTRHHRRMSGLVTYGSQSSNSARPDSQTSITSSATMPSKHSRSSAHSPQTMSAIEDRGG
ncbi:hypothetical protein DL769_008721 [Monosporascus sp. CRB-8-3]|nr:hypothetical protein DL769_008721 [Monosporascus sp. CRB-8-3]